MLTTDKVAIQTTSIAVKVIRIGKRQMTQAVFRQLPELPIIDPYTGEIRGNPWGRVQYFWGDCVGEYVSTHLHIVWQKETTLYRACEYPIRIRQRPGIYAAQEQIDELCEWLTRLGECRVALDILHSPEQGTNMKLGSKIEVPFSGFRAGKMVMNVSCDDSRSEICLALRDFVRFQRQVQFLKESGADSGTDFFERSLKDASEAKSFLGDTIIKTLDGILQQYPYKKGPNEPTQLPAWIDAIGGQMIDDWYAATKAKQQLWRRFDESYAALEALDQLFIAV